MFFRDKTTAVTAERALVGRSQPMAVTNRHFVNGHPIQPPFPAHLREAVFALGCFWGAERKFWMMDGVYTTAVGYTAGFTPNPTYHEVCSGQTGHAEAVRVIFDPDKVTYRTLLAAFFEAHDPTQGMRQGNDVGSQYRSGIYTADEEQAGEARAAMAAYQEALSTRGDAVITTEIRPLSPFYYAEDAHQQYLAKNPGGYCGLGGTGVSFPASA